MSSRNCLRRSTENVMSSTQNCCSDMRESSHKINNNTQSPGRHVSLNMTLIHVSNIHEHVLYIMSMRKTG